MTCRGTRHAAKPHLAIPTSKPASRNRGAILPDCVNGHEARERRRNLLSFSLSSKSLKDHALDRIELLFSSSNEILLVAAGVIFHLQSASRWSAVLHLMA